MAKWSQLSEICGNTTQHNYFFDINKDETSASVRWEAFKAYIRGQIISYTSSVTNKTNLEMLTLDKSIKQLEREVDRTNPHTQEISNPQGKI